MKKNILVVDDSALMRRVTSDIINADERFCVTDYAKNGFEAVDMILKNYHKYSAVVLDINMPRMTGLEVLEQLGKNKVNIKVIVSSTVAIEGAKETILALELGAFDFVTKPMTYSGAKNSDFGARLIQKLECAAFGDTGGKARIPVEEYEKQLVKVSKSVVKESKVPAAPANITKRKDNKLVFIASSTGGPKALQMVVPYISKAIDAPIVIVQHMPEGFTNSLAQRLNELSDVSVSEAKDGEKLEKAHVYIVPGGRHTTFTFDKNGEAYFIVKNGQSINGLKPCADVTLKSLEQSPYEEITCAVLTGMGHDATQGIIDIKTTNKLHIISQNEETCVVYGMPRSIEKTGIVDKVLPLGKIAIEITNHVGVQKNGC